MSGIPLFDLDQSIYLYLKNTSEPLAILAETAEPLVASLLKQAAAGDLGAAMVPTPLATDPSHRVASELNDVAPP